MKYIARMIKKWEQLIKFSLVGLLNTVFSYLLMQAAYHFLGMGYWGSSAAAYGAGAVFSFALNKRFTFQNRDKVGKAAVKYAVNIAVCYLLAYGMARSVISRMLARAGGGAGAYVVDQVSLICGMVLYVLFNYLGQAKFVFHNKIHG